MKLKIIIENDITPENNRLNAGQGVRELFWKLTDGKIINNVFSTETKYIDNKPSKIILTGEFEVNNNKELASKKTTTV